MAASDAKPGPLKEFKIRFNEANCRKKFEIVVLSLQGIVLIVSGSMIERSLNCDLASGDEVSRLVPSSTRLELAVSELETYFLSTKTS